MSTRGRAANRLQHALAEKVPRSIASQKLEIGDDAVLQRADDVDGVGRAAGHLPGRDTDMRPGQRMRRDAPTS